MHKQLSALILSLALITSAIAAEAPTVGEIQGRLREIALMYQKMEADLKAAQLTIRNIQLEAPALKAEEEALRAKLEAAAKGKK